MRIHFAGVRGSWPRTAPSFARYGSDTTCVLVSPRAGPPVFLDAGTGIAGTVEQLPRPHGEILLLLTHTHHDHLRGLLALGAGQKAGWRPTVAAPEFALRQGWGHSSLGECVAAARVGGVGRLRTTHHAPDRDDTALAAAETGLASLL